MNIKRTMSPQYYLLSLLLLLENGEACDCDPSCSYYCSRNNRNSGTLAICSVFDYFDEPNEEGNNVLQQS